MEESKELPFFSIILPTYNRAHLLKTPVKSILDQTFTSWELIIVDDGSTDDTSQIVNSFKDKRIIYLFQKNQERSAARNNGIENARGKYICFLDSDDYYLPQHLESFYKKIEKENFPKAVFFCNTLEDNDGKLTEFPLPLVQARNEVERVVQISLGSPRCCVHRDIFYTEKFDPSITVGEDVDLWVRVLKKFPLIHNPVATVVFVSHTERTVDIGREDSFKAHLQLLKKIFSEDHEKFISNEVRKKTLSNALFRLAQHYIHKEKKWKAINALVRSFFISPKNRPKEIFYLLLQLLPVTKQLLDFYSNRKGQLSSANAHSAGNP